MRRRDLLKLSTSAVVLAVPRVARARRDRTLTFVPFLELALLDPIWTTARATHLLAYAVFDTLYGLDESYIARPQMVEGHTVEANRMVWSLRLRDSLIFHDTTPVLARDVVASLRRWGVRDGYGQALFAATAELTAPDDRTVRFRLNKPFPHLPEALGGASALAPCIMPERLANTDPFRQVTELVGSGPYQFLHKEYNAGSRAALQRFAGYVPRPTGSLSYCAGPKVAHFDRIEWVSMPDTATAMAALQTGEVDWLENVYPDQIPVLARNPNVNIDVLERPGSIGIMRFNHLHPPFNNSAIRRALLGAIDQTEAMQAVAGAAPTYWRDGVGLFTPDNPLATRAGTEILTSPRDYARVKRDLADAGYQGERVVVLATAGSGFITPLAQVGADQLRRAGMNVDLQIMDNATLIRRRANKAPVTEGGWNVFFALPDGLFAANPASSYPIRGNGAGAAEGWPTSAELERLRTAWLDAETPEAEKRISEQLQQQLWRDVPYIPMGQVIKPTAYRRDVVDLPSGFPAFYGVRRA
jgi:peptide/nickel transport system substrate-binding protein